MGSPLPWSGGGNTGFQHVEVEFTKGNLDMGIRAVTLTITVSMSISPLP